MTAASKARAIGRRPRRRTAPFNRAGESQGRTPSAGASTAAGLIVSGRRRPAARHHLSAIRILPSLAVRVVGRAL